MKHRIDEEASLRRERVFREIVRRLNQIDDGTGRRTRYFFAAIFIQENTKLPAYSSREVERLWNRWQHEEKSGEANDTANLSED